MLRSALSKGQCHRLRISSTHNRKGSDIVGNYSVPITRHGLVAMHSLAMSGDVLAELVTILSAKIFA